MKFLDFSENIYIRVIQKSILLSAYTHLIILGIYSVFSKNIKVINFVNILELNLISDVFENVNFFVGGFLYLVILVIIFRYENKN